MLLVWFAVLTEIWSSLLGEGRKEGRRKEVLATLTESRDLTWQVVNNKIYYVYIYMYVYIYKN